MKKSKVMLYIMVMLALICTNAYATISGNINIASSTQMVETGKEFVVTLSLNDIEAENGITSLNGYININKNILEPLTVESIVKVDGKVKINENNDLPVYDSGNVNANADSAGIVFNTSPVSGDGDYRIVINLNEAISSNTNLVKITFKVKDGAEEGTYEDAIEYKLFQIFSGTTDKYEVAAKSLDLTVKKAQVADPEDNNTGNTQEPSGETQTPGDNNQPEPSTGNDGNGSAQQGQTQEPQAQQPAQPQQQQPQPQNNPAPAPDNSLATTALPNTGYRVVLIPVIAVAILGLVFYCGYRKYKNI